MDWPSPIGTEFARDDRAVLPELESPALAEVVSLAAKVAWMPSAPALLVGEPGAPTEAVAKLIHDRTPGTRAESWVSVHCQGLPEELVEHQLFGGSSNSPRGELPAVNRAARGTLFIDRISDLGASAQARLLALLETTHRARRSIRVIGAAATNLALAVRERRFRADLLMRLSVVTIVIPPLRSRAPDIERLALVFLRESARSVGKSIEGLSSDAIAKLRAYAFPSNEEELRSTIDRATLLEPGNILRGDSIYLHGLGLEAPASDLVADIALEQGRPATLAEMERAYITWMIRHANGNRTAAARMLGISYPTIAKKIADHGINFRTLRARESARSGTSK